MAKAVDYEIYAIKYAERSSTRARNFHNGDAHDGPMPMDYFVWALKGGDRTILVDCGFNQETASALGRTLVRDPVDSLRLIGVDAQTVEDVIITHLHYDHAGCVDRFERAKLHLQERELQFVVSRYMKYPAVGRPFLRQDIRNVVDLNFDGRVVQHNGVTEIAPGVTIHLAAGHTPGMQFVRVRTKRGWVVLASDVAHYYENFQAARPFPNPASLPQAFEAMELARLAADSDDHIVPGHDPMVLQRYPAADKGLEGIAVRLDLEPVGVDTSLSNSQYRKADRSYT